MFLNTKATTAVTASRHGVKGERECKMASLPPGLPGLNVSVHVDEATEMTEILNQTRDSIQRLVQSLQSGLVDDKDTSFEYEDANGQVQVRNEFFPREFDSLLAASFYCA